MQEIFTVIDTEKELLAGFLDLSDKCYRFLAWRILEEMAVGNQGKLFIGGIIHHIIRSVESSFSSVKQIMVAAEAS